MSQFGNEPQLISADPFTDFTDSGSLEVGGVSCVGKED